MNPHNRAQQEGECIREHTSAGGLPYLDHAPHDEQDGLHSAGKATHKPTNHTAAGMMDDGTVGERSRPHAMHECAHTRPTGSGP
jgi:hypothetical protein